MRSLDKEVSLRRIAVLGTGGTIASRATDQGVVAADSVEMLIDAATLPGDLDVVTREVLTIGSYALTLTEQATIVESILAAQADPEIDGIVVTHGTDAMEETAFLADLVSTNSTPVVFTGAQRAADLPSPDGPGNLAEAIELAAREELSGHGVMIYFAEIGRASGRA